MMPPIVEVSGELLTVLPLAAAGCFHYRVITAWPFSRASRRQTGFPDRAMNDPGLFSEIPLCRPSFPESLCPSNVTVPVFGFASSRAGQHFADFRRLHHVWRGGSPLVIGPAP